MTGTNRAAALALAAALLLPAPARAGLLEQARKTDARALAVDVQRSVLPNGLVVLLAPDPTATGVAVWMSFRAGAIHEPPGRSGLAHLVEHLVASGPTPATDYGALLERRRARHWNASTGFDAMTFEAVLPAEELPLGLWVLADRLVSVPPLVDDALVERHRRVIVQERALVHVDTPYGLVTERLFGRLYPAPHPLHGGVLGVPAELAAVTAEDVRAFVRTHLVPANAVLTIVGRFEPEVARRLVAERLGTLPPGAPAPRPRLPAFAGELVEAEREPLARTPRVTFAWRFPELPQDHALALELGSQLLGLLTDGAWGMRLSAGLAEYAGEALFTVELTVPYDEPMSAVHGDVDGFLRLLTHREMPLDFMIAANLALDRYAMLELDGLEGRARLLTRLEERSGSRLTVADRLGRRWELDGSTVRDTARAYLRSPKLVLHARPARPKPARAERE
jgi:predicted Zn-dependent peptidase